MTDNYYQLHLATHKNDSQLKAVPRNNLLQICCIHNALLTFTFNMKNKENVVYLSYVIRPLF